MKLISVVLALTLLLPGRTTTDSGQLLQQIWSAYDPSEQFSVYGGQPEQAVQGRPGELDICNGDMLSENFCVPQQLHFAIEEGASLVHLMNRCVFSAAVFRLAPNQDAEAFAAVLRGSIRKAQWEGSRPEQCLIMIPAARYILVAFGKQRLLDTFLLRTEQVFPQGKLLYDEQLPV